MSKNLSPSAKKFQDLLRGRGFRLEVVEIPEGTRTSADAATALGCRLGQIAKSIVFEGRNTHKPVLVIASGPNRVNEALIGKRLGEPIAKGDADFVRRTTGHVIGGVPPMVAKEIKVFIDEDLMLHGEIWAAAGTPHAVFKLTPGDLAKMTSGEVIRVK